MSNRKYRLLKDLPGIKAGEIFKPSSRDEYWYNTEKDSIHTRILGKWVTNNPEWFEEVKEPEAPARIGVQFFPCGTDALNGMFVHSVAIGKQITREEAPALERAIEAVVNGEPHVITTDIQNGGRQYKVCVGGVEYAPKGFWTDALVNDFVMKIFRGEIRTGVVADSDQILKAITNFKSGEQSKQGGGL